MDSYYGEQVSPFLLAVIQLMMSGTLKNINEMLKTFYLLF